MKEEIVRLESEDAAVDRACGECGIPLSVGDEVVVCPRCKQEHHLECWVKRGGCARHGCRQVMSPSLRPPKDEQPITVKRTPTWVIIAAIAAIVAVSVGLYVNGRRAATLRESSAYVLIPSLEDQAFWERTVEEYNETPTGAVHPATLIITPYGPGGTYFEQKLFVMIAAKDSPEFVVLEEERLRRYAEEGALEPLNLILQDLESAGIPLDAESVQSATLDGSVYGIPHPSREAYFVVGRNPRNPEAARAIFPYMVDALYEDAQSTL